MFTRRRLIEWHEGLASSIRVLRVDYSNSKLQIHCRKYSNQLHEHFARFEKSTTKKTLVDENTSVLKSLRTPVEIRGICWNKRVTGLKPIERTSITITFSTAQQANEAIEHGLLWNHERRHRRKQGPHPKITQCRNCLAYGHILKYCSSAPRCRVCAGVHFSKECTWDPVTDKACRKCALCGGAHDATNE